MRIDRHVSPRGFRRDAGPFGPRAHRSGFTLIELLTVIVVIGMLMVLLLPAINAVRRNAHVAKVRSEISQLDSALADFRAKYGVTPPSRITLCETATGWNSNDAEIVRSKAILRQIWPQFDFSINRNINPHNGLLTAGTGTLDNDTTDTHTLVAGECLLFFLGGIMYSPDATTRPTPVGFSSNPRDPFALGGSRVGPFFPFDINRFTNANASAGSQMLEYKDSLFDQTRPYFYFSSYDGAGYELADVTPTSAMTDVYRVTAGGQAYNPKGVQIISPGFDQQYGTGGVFDPGTASETFVDTRQVERDNITNFHTGLLAP